MGFVKCPRCELNYIQDTEDYCEVCKREIRTKFSREDEPETLELCAECNERPALPGEELCAICKRENIDEDEDEEGDILEDPLTISEVSEMEEIELDDDIPDDIDDGEMDDEDEEDDALTTLS